MLITKASEYAILSLIVLSRADAPKDTDTLSRELFISKSFLAKILQALAKNDILKSYKGANGGFVLNKSPKDIDILSIVTSVEGKTPSVFECSANIESCPTDKGSICSIWPMLNRLQKNIDAFLADLTLNDILEEK
ncbi:MAG: Rrf2 family transcriptional regulator [Epsilonproteobacteria bacterium]|nr:Rrf2 family transcriptional regulator [Campylobacterota bacterium]